MLAYGTNEAFDARRVDAYANEVSELVSRLRRGAPDADCLILGPPDSAAPDYSSLPRVAEIEAVLARTAAKLGCASYSLRESMGGTGSFLRWLKETPPLARGDRFISPARYERMGEMLADNVMAGMGAKRPQVSSSDSLEPKHPDEGRTRAVPHRLIGRG